MTYTFKLARRLAVSRNFIMLPVLLLFAACVGGDATAPTESPAGSQWRPRDLTPVAVRVEPGSVTLETNQLIHFRAHGRTRAGDSVSAAVTWSTTGGTILPDGRFSAAAIGTYKVIGRNRVRGVVQIDSSVVVVVRRQPRLASVQVNPVSASLTPGVKQTFRVVGHLFNGTTVPIGANWFATGGAIDGGGTFTAGDSAGTYRVIATNTAGTLADTATITIAAAPSPAPEPPPPPPLPVVEKVTLVPATATLAASTKRQFAAYGRTTAGDSVAVSVVFTATGGTVTPDGLFTASANTGTFRVIATSGALADTSTVTVTRPLGSGTPTGVPFGPFDLWTTVGQPIWGPAPFTMSINADSPEGIAARISNAHLLGQKLVLMMTSGNHNRYLTNGAFDMAKWKARMDLFNTPGIKAAVAAGLADGTILGADILDEPQHTSWNGTITKPMLDEMASYVKAIFPGIPAGTSCRWDFRSAERYKVVDFITTQYAYFFGSITAWRDGALKAAAENGIAINFSFNVINGGTYIPGCPVPQTGGPGDRPGVCRMTPDQVRTAGLTLGPDASGLFLWKYDAAFMADPANVQAFKDVANGLATVQPKSWRRP